jgi:predicted nucleic acid-binding protein
MKNFFDTNILAYTYDVAEPEKYRVASELFPKGHAITSTQVLGELSNVLSGKLRFPWPSIDAAIRQITNKFTIHVVSTSTILKAVSLAERYKYSYYDSLILASAIESKCEVLYSEDFQHNQLIEGVRIINPFL